MVQLFRSEGRFDDAQTHLESAKLHAVNNPYYLGHVTGKQAVIWYKQSRLEEARSEALRAAEIFNKLGTVEDAECCRGFLGDIEKKLNSPAPSGRSGFNRELL